MQQATEQSQQVGQGGNGAYQAGGGRALTDEEILGITTAAAAHLAALQRRQASRPASER